MFHSYKRLIDIDRAQVDSLRKHGIKTCQIMDYMMDQKGGLVGASLHKHGVKTSQIMNYMMDQKGGLVGAGFIKKGFVQLYWSWKVIEKKQGDVMATLSYLEDKAYSDPISSSKYSVFEDGKLRHLF